MNQSTSPPNHFRPYDDASQPATLVPGYKETLTRNPRRPLIARPATLSEITGPTRLARKLPSGIRDLSRKSPQGPRAMGQLILVRGRLLDEDGCAVRDSVVELWHANAAGRYQHPMDAQSAAPLDEHFLGSGRVLTDAQGRYEFITVKPGAYPVPEHAQRWWRPPHIHISVFGTGFMSRLVTQMFFPGDPLNQSDLILGAVPDAKGRARMVAQQIAMMDMAMPNVVGYQHDIVVRGERRTPFEK
jgi:protocatechuate 3,4-dioxygenase beta subunit